MGVYYIVVNDSKKEYVDAFYFGENIKLGGLLQGLHGSGVAQLLVHPPTEQMYSSGYWAGDSIRAVGDNHESEYEVIKNEYRDISFYILANVFENSTKETRDKIINISRGNKEILKGLHTVNNEYKYTNLNYSLNKLSENKT